MKILLAGNGKYIQFAPSWVEALKTLDHDVEFFDFSLYSSKGLLGKLEHHMIYKRGFDSMNSRLLAAARDYMPDITVIHNGNVVYRETIIRLKDICWVAGYQHDDPFGAFGSSPLFNNFKKTISSYNSHHVIRRENLTDYEKMGCKKAGLLPTYFVPWLHYRKENVSKTSDVVFIGHAERDNRLECLEKLIDKGVNLRIAGPQRYWNRYFDKKMIKKLPEIKAVRGQDYLNSIYTSKILLGFYSKANRDKYAYRIFEIPACGGFLLSERTEVVKEFYAEDKEIVLFSSADELYDKVTYYLKNERGRAAIAQKGYERAMSSGYDVISRMKQWVGDTKKFIEQE